MIIILSENDQYFDIDPNFHNLVFFSIQWLLLLYWYTYSESSLKQITEFDNQYKGKYKSFEANNALT